MTKQEYLAELNTYLMSLPLEEREDAVRFYEEYFEDAGPENEQAVIDELGKPFALAKSIICEQSAYSKSKSYANFKASKLMEGSSPTPDAVVDDTPDIMPETTEKPHTQYTAYNYSYGNDTPNNEAESFYEKEQKSEMNSKYDTSYEAYKENYKAPESSYTNTSSSNTNNTDTVTFILSIVFGAIFVLPILIMLILLFVAFGIATIGSIIGAVITAVGGFVIMFANFGGGMFILGISLMCAGLGFLFAIPAILGLFKFTPWIIKSIIKFFKKTAGGII